ncbi:double-strand break repair protein AddB [Sphingomonas swuensis]|uniref:Double-strand break repair protein AddB n=1 Tax=Sphingomonas swuensis TaxID=977800 RepID=A0ABP7SSX4_9SPHN
MSATDAGRRRVFSIPAQASFADALARELVRRHAGDPLALARGRILLPNARAVRTVTEAFVRASGTGLLLPRLIPIGDPALDERIGGALEPPSGPAVPPAIDPLTRQAELARAVLRRRGGSSAEAWRLAGELARTLDQLLIEEVEVARLRQIEPGNADLAFHQTNALEQLSVILDEWPAQLRALGRIDLADRRNLLLRDTARRWKAVPPDGFTIAAGITTSAKSIAELLAVVAAMPEGAVVLPGLADRHLLSDAQWQALGLEEGERDEPTHPQYHLKLLLGRMGVNRAEVEAWPIDPDSRKRSGRARVASLALTAARFSHEWQKAGRSDRSLGGVRLAILPDPASEAQAIALALREALEVEGRTAALVTPDRALARRVGALLRRWEIVADDSAGTPLGQTPPGTLLLAIAGAAAERLGPVSLLGMLGHPLVRSGEGRKEWLDDVRALDLGLRGPRPAAGIEGIDRMVEGSRLRGLGEAWKRLRPAVEPLETMLDGPLDLAALAGRLREAGSALAGDALWSGPAGRAAADLLAEVEASASAAALGVLAEDSVPLLRLLLDGQAIRPPYGQHPRVQILGLLEARLVKTDLMVLGGLNEGSWPATPAPDPWLPVKLKKELELPAPDTRIGLAAHDFASLLCAPEVLLTRARRDGRSPTVSSRLLLRLQALTGGLPRDRRLEGYAAALDEPAEERPAKQPAPRPPVAERPKQIRVTDLDRLKSDPFAFYARTMLGLSALDPLEADQDSRWKGTLVHLMMEQWLKEDACAPDRLLDRARLLLAADDIHPMLRALWGPRLIEAIGNFAGIEARQQDEGRRPLEAEAAGEATISGVRLYGRADRIDRGADGRLVILDYKTGSPPTQKQVDEGFALQLGLLGMIAEADGFRELRGAAGGFEYWSLAREKKGAKRPGYRLAMDQGDPAAFLATARQVFAEAVGRWLTGDDAFTAKLRPAYARYDDYDQLMRLEEWAGRKR